MVPDRSGIDFHLVMGVLYFNAPFKFQDQILEAQKELFNGAVRFARVAKRLLEEGKIRTHPKDVRKGGLRGVLGGIEDLKERSLFM